MKHSADVLRMIAADAELTADALNRLADDLEQAADGNISQADVRLHGIGAAEAFVRENKPLLDRMG